MASIPTGTTSPSSSSNGQTYRGPVAIMTVLFYMWGFMTVFNDIRIKAGNEHGLQYSFIVPLLAYAYVAFHGWKGHKIGRRQTSVA